MWRRCAVLRRNYRLSLKYPALVSYNKLPWETLAPESPAIHQHLAPHLAQVLRLAAVTSIPRFHRAAHPVVDEAHRMRVLPGAVYVLSARAAPPEGFEPHRIADTVSLQYYGDLHHRIGALDAVDLLVSSDLHLLGLQLHFNAPLHLPLHPSSSLSAATAAGGGVSLFHFFLPHRSPADLTRPLERFLRQHRPHTEGLIATFGAGSADWVPQLQPPKRQPDTRRASMPAYSPPQSYLMGLAERLAVRPGDAFGKRGLMWGHWF
eukprot:gene11402-7907_t